MTVTRRFMLDTNIASAIIRAPTPGLAERLKATPIARLCVSAVTEAELRYGVARKPDAANLHKAVDEFLVRIDILSWDSDAAKSYGILRAELAARGTLIGNMDLLIAAHALAVDAVLVTNDQAFVQVPALILEDWLALSVPGYPA